MSLVVLDTDAASVPLRRRLAEQLAGRPGGNVLAVTFVTVGELTKWTLVRQWGPQPVETMRWSGPCASATWGGRGRDGRRTVAEADRLRGLVDRTTHDGRPWC